MKLCIPGQMISRILGSYRLSFFWPIFLITLLPGRQRWGHSHSYEALQGCRCSQVWVRCAWPNESLPFSSFMPFLLLRLSPNPCLSQEHSLCSEHKSLPNYITPPALAKSPHRVMKVSSLLVFSLSQFSHLLPLFAWSAPPSASPLFLFLTTGELFP